MDPTEDLSARVLLKHILNAEPPRTPVTRSGPQEPSGSGLRRSGRISRKDGELQTPQNILRRSLKHKIHETVTRKSLPATKRRTATVVLRKLAPSTSMLFNDDETPRHLLRNILQTEPVKSPVVHEEAAVEELPPPSDDTTATRTRSSIELSGLDLPDVTIGNVVSAAKVLSRKRPRRSLNVSAFEKRLKDGNDAEEESEYSVGDLSSLSLSSSTSLSLKTPFVDVHTEKRVLKRRVSNRRKITEEDFSAALSKQQMGDVRQFTGEDTNVEGITLGLSGLSGAEITADIVNCDTALYDQPDAMTSNFSILATQDKPTVMASQLQRDVQETQEWEEERSGIRSGPEKDEGVSESRGKDADKTETQDAAADAQPDDAQDTAVSSKSKALEGAAGYQTFILEAEEAQTEEEAVAEAQSEEAEGGSQSEEEEAAEGPQAENESMDHSPPEEEARGESQSFGLEDRAESEGEEEAAAESPSEDIGTGSQSEEEEATAGSHIDDDGRDQSQTEEEDGLPETDEAEDATAASRSEEEEAAASSQTEDEGGSEPQAEETAANKSQCDVVEESQSERDGADCQSDEDGGDQGEAWGSELLERDLGHVSRRAYRSEGGLPLPAIKAKQDPTDATAAEESQSERDGADCQSDEDGGDQGEAWGSELLERDVGHVSRRAYRSEGGLPLPAIKAKQDPTDATAAESKSNTSLGLEIPSQSQSGKPDGPQPSLQEQADDSWVEKDPVAGNQGSFHLPQVSHEAEVNGQESDASPEEAPVENAAEQEEWDEEEDDDYEEFPSKTPAFVREKRVFFTSDPPASPSVLQNAQMSSTSGPLPEAKPRQVRRRRTGPSRKEAVLPKTYLMSVFKHFAKTKVSADVFPALNEIMDTFFHRLAEDLETYAAHAKRKTIEVEDVKLLLRRQGYINDKVPVEVLIEKYLRMEQRKNLIPIATSGNVVIPKIRK